MGSSFYGTKIKLFVFRELLAVALEQRIAICSMITQIICFLYWESLILSFLKQYRDVELVRSNE